MSPAIASALLAWRRSVETRIMDALQTSLLPSQLDHIRDAFVVRRQALVAEKHRESERIQGLENALKYRYNLEKLELDRLDRESRSRNAKEVAAIKAEVSECRKRLLEKKRLAEEQYRSKLRQVDELARPARKELMRLSHKISAAEREMRAFSNISFTEYCKCVLLFWRLERS